MDINKIELSPYVIASLYRNSLIEPLQESHSVEKKTNQKNILILVNHSAKEDLPKSQLVFLEGILKACQLHTDDVSIINLSHHSEKTYKEFTKSYKPKNVLMFGVDPAEISLPVNFPHFQPQSFTNVTYLYSPSLQELENDKLLKSKLWVCLKRIFGI